LKLIKENKKMTKPKTLHFCWTAFPLILLVLLLPVTPGLAQHAAGKPDSVDTWSAGPNLPTVVTRAAGVFFPANGKFYSMGGRTSDVQGSELTNPLEYDPVANTWTIDMAVTYPDTITNNMACGVLTESGTPYIYCAGGSQVGTNLVTGRVFRYNPVTHTIATVAADWPAGATTLPGGFTVFSNNFYILGGFGNPPTGNSTNQIWEFTPSPAGWVLKNAQIPDPLGLAYIPTATIGNRIYTGGGANIAAGSLTDTTDSYVYNPVADTISTITAIPRATSNTRALNVYGLMWVLGGGFPTPVNEVDIYNPYCNAWTVGTPFVNARRNFPTDTDGVSRVWLAGGYVNAVPDMSMEIDKFPMVTSAASRRVHGGAGTFDIALPLNGPTGIECRTGPNYQIVVNFATSVTVGSASVTCGTGSVGSISGNGTSTIAVNLTGVTDVQRITVTLANVTDGTNTGDIPVSMGVLVGDTTANGVVNAGDVSQTKSQSGATVTNSNFREDVNASGTISSTDVAIVKSDVGTALPP
jgi:hypothetical protein